MQVKCQQSVQHENRIWCLRSLILSWHCLHCWWLCFLRNYKYTEVSLLTASLPFDGLRNLSILKCGSRKVGKVRVFMDCKSWIFSLSCRIIISASCWAILSDNEWSTVFSSGIILDAEACFSTDATASTQLHSCLIERRQNTKTLPIVKILRCEWRSISLKWCHSCTHQLSKLIKSLKHLKGAVPMGFHFLTQF